MIVIDTSALIAVLLGEPEREAILRVIEAADRVLISTASLLEARMVMHGRLGQRGVILLDDFVSQPSFELAAPDARQADIAYQAFVKFGRGSGHPAGLNYGDLFSYALARAYNAPLLFKGEDFARTDLQPALVETLHDSAGSI